MDNNDAGFIETHLPCPDCDSSDALCVNENGSTKCFSCGKYTPAKTETTKPILEVKTKRKENDNFLYGDLLPIAPRGIHLDTCKKYGYYVGDYKGERVHIANYRNFEGELVGQKIRDKDKNFEIKGNITDCFFGQHLWPNGGKKLIICEGEIDCLTVSQLGSNKYPCISIPSGTNSAKGVFKKNLKWLELFDEVVIMFDMDEPGQKAMSECVGILPPGKALIAKLPGKDPNELLMQGKAQDVVRAMFDAKKWSPTNIIDGADLFERISTVKKNDSVPYPFKGLTEKTKGIRKGEISLFCAGSGVGKSQVCRQIAHHLLTQTKDKKVGYIALEENIERSAQGVLGLELGKLLHLDEFVVDDKYRSAFKKTVGSGRFFLYDHWGSLNTDQLLSHIRYLVKALGVEYVVLDHISIVVSGMSESEMGNERRAIDVLMTKLRTLVEECNFALILVSHLKRPEGNRGYEDGIMPNLSALRGSQALSQLSDICIALSRDLQGEDKNTTKLSVLKNRFSGETGLCSHLEYCQRTGRLTETEISEEF
tara:strand:+ start:24574 stop:26187 length:1614 start_codon:yes stop_codon:yes gene_type:complete